MYEVENRLTDADVSEDVGEFLDQALDLTARFLTDRTDLGASAVFALNRVCREGPIRLTTLAAKEGVRQPSMTQLIQRLERHDLVTRLPDPDDGRACLIGITDSGQRLLEDRKRLRRQRLKTLLATLSSEDQCSVWLSAQVASPVLLRLVASAETPGDGIAAHPDEAETIDARRVAQQQVFG